MPVGGSVGDQLDDAGEEEGLFLVALLFLQLVLRSVVGVAAAGCRLSFRISRPALGAGRPTGFAMDGQRNRSVEPVCSKDPRPGPGKLVQQLGVVRVAGSEFT